MSWKSSNRKARLPSNWPTLRKQVLRRDEHQCRWKFDDGSYCLNYANQVDHIRRGDDHRLSNLRALCEFHHSKKSSAEGSEAYWSRVNQSKKKFRHDEVHPAYRRAEKGGRESAPRG